MSQEQNTWLHPQRRLLPDPVRPGCTVDALIDNAFQAYNGARLREAAQLLTTRIMADDCITGLSLSGALTPAGLGVSCIIPLMEHGLVDWISSTGAILYHDAHFGLDMSLYRGWVDMNDRRLREDRIIRIYDVLFEDTVLFDTDAFFRRLLALPEFQASMGTAGFHNLLGKYLAEREQVLGLHGRSLLAAAYRLGIPVFTSAPADSSIGMNAAAMNLLGKGVRLDTLRDVNETAAIVHHAKTTVGRSAVVIFGGGSPKNFMLQTEPQLQEVLAFDVTGHDYFIQVTDARPDTGGLSGATPSEAVTWGKINPDQLANTLVCYTDTTIAMPLLTAYVLSRTSPRSSRRLFERLPALLEPLRRQAMDRLESPRDGD